MATEGENVFGPAQPDAPPVIGAEHVAEEPEAPAAEEQPEPEPAYLPTEPVDEHSGEVCLHLRHTEDGERTLLVFTQLDLLTSCLGAQQPWIAVPTEQIERIQRECEADLVFWDTVRPEQP